MSDLDLAGYLSGDVTLPALLESLPAETTMEFESLLTELAVVPEKSRVAGDLRSILENSEDSARTYAAFYCLNIILRRNRDVTLLEDLINARTPTFKDHPTFQHLLILFRREKGLGRHYEDVLLMAYDDSLRFPNHPGVIHLFAHTVASIGEGLDSDSRKIFCAEWLERAIDAVDGAIDLKRKYAKFYSTKGRLVALAERYDEAVSLIRKAIHLEDSAMTDYAIRIGDYQSSLLRVQAAKTERDGRKKMDEQISLLKADVAEARSRVDESIKRADDSSIRNLEFLGFFAALISFTIGSIQISLTQKSAPPLIVVLFGALLCAFAGFSFIVRLDLKSALLRALPVFIVGAIVIVIGFHL